MMGMKKFFLVTLLVSFYAFSYGAYLTDIPITVYQPDGMELQIYASGDEYYNWLHDKNGYTIVINTEGYYVYAQLDEKNDKLYASCYIVGKSVPQNIGIKPCLNISSTNIMSLRSQQLECDTELSTKNSNSKNISSYPTIGGLNNIVIYIRFADQTEFTDSQVKYTNLFNNDTVGRNSLFNYFKETSYNQLFVTSTFYPLNNGSTILSYQDIHTSAYYSPQTISIDSGYTNDSEKAIRKADLLVRAINYVKNDIPATLNIDSNNDGDVDNISFIIRGSSNGWADLLWPHMGELHGGGGTRINGKYVNAYNFQLENVINTKGVGVLCHEFCHSLGAPDLYHYDNDGYVPIGIWDLMASETNPPQHMSACVKWNYFHWISAIPEIMTTGTYYLNPLTDSANNCYKIAISGSPDFLILEYRKKSGIFEMNLPNSGLLIYRIHPNSTGEIQGNQYGQGLAGTNNGIFVYRKDGTMNSNGSINFATFSKNSGRTRFSSNSNPQSFLSDNSIANVLIKNISVAEDSISFYVKFCDGDNIQYTNTSNLPTITNASNSVSTNGVVTVKSTDDIIFEARNSVVLDKNFFVNLGGTLKINMDGCFE